MVSGIACSFYTTKVIVAQMSKSPIDYVHAYLTIALPVMFATGVCCNLLPPLPGNLSDQDVTLLTLAVIVGHYLYYVGGVVSDLAKHLNIYVFSIEKRNID